MKRFLIVIATVMVLVTGACRLPFSKATSDESSGDARYPGVAAEALGQHRSQFHLEFDGAQDWSYQLLTSRAGPAVGHELQIDGVPLSVSPGDVRLIIDSERVQMSGEATEGDCWLFPEKSELQRSFLSPDSVFDPSELNLEQQAEQESVSGRKAVRYGVSEGFSERWHDIQGTLWLDEETGALLRFEFSARGQDPFFESGSGRLEGDYGVLDFGDQDLQPIEGCELPYPVPEDASDLVLLEDYLSFETNSTRSDMIQFYAFWLEDEGWELVEGPLEGQFGTTMSFRQGDRMKEVSAREMEEGTQVEIFSEAAE